MDSTNDEEEDEGDEYDEPNPDATTRGVINILIYKLSYRA
jgi:hypothetical protein